MDVNRLIEIIKKRHGSNNSKINKRERREKDLEKMKHVQPVKDSLERLGQEIILGKRRFEVARIVADELQRQGRQLNSTRIEEALRILEKQGIQTPKRRFAPLDEKTKKAVLEEYKKNKSIKKTAAELGLKYDSVANFIFNERKKAAKRY